MAEEISPPHQPWPGNRLIAALDRAGAKIPDQPIALRDLLVRHGVDKLLIVVTPGRAGSTLLADLIHGLGGLGNPLEYFAEDVLGERLKQSQANSLVGYVDWLATHTADSGYFSFKTTPARYQFLQQVFDFQGLERAGGTRWIHIKRQDIVAQSHSMARAVRSGNWHVIDGETRGRLTNLRAEEGAGDVDFQELWVRLLVTILRAEQDANQLFQDLAVDPFHLQYEELVASLPLVTRRLAFFLDGRKLDLASVPEHRTAKMAGGEQTVEQLGFFHRHAEIIQDIFAQRETIDPAMVAVRMRALLEAS